MHLYRETAPQTLVFIFALILLILIVLEGDRTNRELLAANELVAGTYADITELQELFVLLQDIETSERGYLLTGDEDYLAPYTLALATINDQYQTVAAHMAELPGQQSNMAALGALIDRKLTVAATNVAVREREGLDAVQERLQRREGKVVMDELRSLMAEMTAEETALLATLSLDAREQASRSRWVALGGGAVALLLLGVAAFVLRQTLVERVRIAKQVDDNAARLQALLDAIPDSLFRIRGQQPPASLSGAGLDPDHATPQSVLTDALRRWGDRVHDIHTMELSDVSDESTGRSYEVRIAKVDATESLAVVREVTEQRRVAQIKNEFISTVSHELRTPLTSIRGALGILASDGATGVSSPLRPVLNIAVKNGERLVALINDILDVERIDSGHLVMQPAPQSIRLLVNQSVEDNLPFAEQFGVHLTLAPTMQDAVVNVDTDRVLQVMANLLSNAIKFSPRDEAIIVGIDLVEDQVQVSVRDHGPGIPTAFHDRIFHRFAQADSSDSRQKGGTGLGLYITRGLMHQMHGHINFASAEGEGTTFYLYFPIITPGKHYP